MAEQEQPKWYILHTYSGYEAMVKDSLEKLIENNNLAKWWSANYCPATCLSK